MTEFHKNCDIELGYRLSNIQGRKLRIPRGIIRLPSGWLVSLRRQNKYVIYETVNDEGQSAEHSLDRAKLLFAEKLKQVPLTKSEIERPRTKNSIDTHMRGVMVSWVRSRRRASRPYMWRSLLVVISVRLEPGKRCTNKSVHAGTRNTVTQESLNIALRKGYAIREHHNRIERGEIPCEWPSIDELLKLYKDPGLQPVDVESVKSLITTGFESDQI